ncbi:MAG: hypothetical protein KJO80_14910 [Gammaproteobacteria bacterium]|nr:hypothetical protein [Gammaproteobacteria bacterium]
MNHLVKALAAVLLPATLAVYASDVEVTSLEECQRIQAQIDYYTELRKKGGSAQKMEHWKQQRDEWNRRFSDEKCRKPYGKKVR